MNTSENTSENAPEEKSDFVKRLERKLGGNIPLDKLEEVQRHNAINNKDTQNINANELTAKIPALKKPKSEEAIKNIENIDQFLKRF